MKLTIDSSIHDVDLSPWAQYINTPYFLGEAGTEPYKLLAHLSAQLPSGSKVADLGTFQSASALALASNPEVQVITYDITDRTHWSHAPNSIRFVKANCLDCVTEFADAALIHLDIDPHDGKQEAVLIHLLKSEQFSGLLVCDDIHLNLAMDELWAAIALKKLEVTNYGHWSGTGIVVFDPKTIDVEVIDGR